MRIPLHLGILLLWTSILGAGHFPAAGANGEPSLIGVVPSPLVVEVRDRDDFEDGRTSPASCGGIPARRVVDPVILPTTWRPVWSVALYKLHGSFLI